MSKRVLLAEQNDTIRGVAETVLRQNGFDIISVNSSEKLFEVIKLSAPDFLLVDANMCTTDGQPTYHKLRNHPSASTVPIALLADEYSESLGLPASAVVLRPFDPANLLNQVNQVISSQASLSAKEGLPSGTNLDDEFLDSALGLDQIEVTDSEDMNKTGVMRTQAKKENTKIMGIGQFEKSGNSPSDSSKIESLIISEDSTDIKAQDKSGPPPVESLSETSGLQLADDQYGLSDPDAFSMDADSGDHDYNWFVNSMKSDDDNPAAGAGNLPAHDPSGDNLDFTSSAGMLDPSAPAPSSPPPAQSPTSQPIASADQPSGGMDKFIDEFRQEVEKIDITGPESILIPEETAAAAPAALAPETDDANVLVQSIPTSDQASWEDMIENVTPDHLKIFSRELAGQLADKIAGLILARIDQDKLLHLIKNELIEELRKKS